ncbi:hypothetical protein [Soonwooa sp.]|uniref:hypothetical protein n=1 Tax=Soonwooa sp. TaxID=1938592 RepID=UPI00260570D2|nr:hypothetical protein [Soonwooa sp.]
MKGITRSKPYLRTQKLQLFLVFVLVLFQCQIFQSQIHLQGGASIVSVVDSNKLKIVVAKPVVPSNIKRVAKNNPKNSFAESKKETKKIAISKLSIKSVYSYPSTEFFSLINGKADHVVLVNSSYAGFSKAIVKNLYISVDLKNFKEASLISKEANLFCTKKSNSFFWARPPPTHCDIV